jgi:chromate transporter
VVLGKRALFDVPTILICLATLAVIIRFKNAPEPLVILAAGALGLLLTQSAGLSTGAGE